MNPKLNRTEKTLILLADSIQRLQKLEQNYEVDNVIFNLGRVTDLINKVL